MYVLMRVFIKEMLQLRQDRRMIPMLIVGPIIQLLVLGYAANNDVVDIPLLLCDRDHTALSRALVDRFTGSGYFNLVGSINTSDAIDPWLVDGRADVALTIESGYGAAVISGRPTTVQVVVDGTDSASALVGLGYAARIVGEESMARINPAVRRTVGRIELVPRLFYNPDLRSRWFYVPAILAMVLMLVTMILPSMAIVREKEIGTLEQLMVTPIRPWQLIGGKLLPYAIVGLLDTLLVTSVAVHLFGVPLRGSLLLLVGLTGLFLLNTLGLGLLVSSLVRNQQQAMMFSIFLVMVPMIYLSGLIFPIENMPPLIQQVTYAIPLRYYAVIIRGVFLKGAGLDVLWPQAVILATSGMAVLALASLRFRKSLD